MTLAAKIDRLLKYGNEIAIGYNASGRHWTLYYGSPGSGAMLDGRGGKLYSSSADFEEAVDELLAEVVRLHGPR
jgi:hypothetical protein